MPSPSPSPYLLQPGRRHDLMLLCDHAGNQVPDDLDGLGLDARELARHIGWDLGALAVARILAERFDAPLWGCLDSRLLADPNRSPDHPDLILAQSEGTFVPGNERLPQPAREARIARFHRPYHDALEQAVEERLGRGARPFLLSIHSFEPVYAGLPRPWPVGVLWKKSDALARRVVAALERRVDPVGCNEPYDGRVALGHTLETHAIPRGLPQLLIEIRNDGIADAAGQQHWAKLIGAALEAALPEFIDPR
ncbi:N-formylglutamate amidohydrolase [Pseudomarimonas salicorniae]|uniref:N-formylglutamate amidohydrolase n=1 Tax=Pseudomarimonas salicorniae TaxID=2933270 RepID=A0ABT0GKD7_9GAMM|nr:N-formylglutamate amidohydrolase [Lysobacter sp. CAU 1642]MCK7594993.1 N-formylglutamate amidohydrolase [Lysobacter sp. CAU 1642]